jgi:hypothetical protein
MFKFSRPGAAASWGRMTRCKPNSRIESQRGSKPLLADKRLRRRLVVRKKNLDYHNLALFVYQLMEAGWHGRDPIGVGLLLGTYVRQGSYVVPQSTTTIQYIVSLCVYQPILKSK